MSAITPKSDVRLLKIDLEIDNRNQINFSNATSQYNYFNSLSNSIILDNFTYQRKDSIIRVPYNIDEIIQYNYVMYRNEDLSDKWYYAYITKMEFSSTKMTEVYIKTDVYQTWQFDISLKRCFVEREHVNDDTIGIHTIPENLETGEYICNSAIDGLLFSSEIIIGATIDLTNSSFPNINGCNSGNVYSGVTYFGYDTVSEVNNLLRSVANAGKTDAINSIFMGNRSFYDHEINASGNYIPKIASSDYKIDVESPISKPTSLNGYTPKNNKLLTYPYCYLYATNRNGASNIYKYEYFSANPFYFKYTGVLTPGMSIKVYPENYNNILVNFEESLPFGKWPICSWNSDVYTNWLTQNSVNVGVSVSSSILQIAGGVGLIGTGAGATAGASSIASGIMGIASAVGSIYQHSLIPADVSGNINNGDINYSTIKSRMQYMKMSIKEEYARIIDEYFSMFGYKINRTKIPNITSRKYWNYIKTIGANIEGFIPQEDLQEIKDMFNNGFTVWHYTNHFLDYSQNNIIL